MKYGINNLWSTPFLYDKIQKNELNQSLLNYTLQEKQTDVFNQRSKIINQFKTEIVLPGFEKFLNQSLNKSISDWASYRLDGWVVKYGEMSMPYHNHRGSQLSLVYYVLSEKTETGAIHFTDPRQNANRGYDLKFLPWFESLKLTVETGDLVIFPSFLYHYVSTYLGNVRIAIPVDLFLFDNN